MEKVKGYDRFKKQYRTTSTEVKRYDVNGFDTETMDGYCFLICDSDGRYEFINSADEWLQFLTYRWYEGKLNFFYNIDFDFFALIKWLPKNIIEDIYHVGKGYYKDYIIEWIPRKAFTIKKGRHTYRFFDIFQFYHSSLDHASKKYLNMQKIDMNRELMNDKDFVKNNLKDIISYCIWDAYLTKRLAELMQQQFNELDISFNKPYSHAKLSEKYAMTQYKIPKFYPTEYQEYALRSYYGGRFECFKRGYIDKVYVYDINSAYPYHISHLPDISLSEWYKVDYVDENANLGFIRCKVTTKYNYTEPLPYRLPYGIVFPHFNDNERFITLQEYRVIKRYNLADIEVLDGWFYRDEYGVRPFKWVEDMYYYRKEIQDENPALAHAIKILMNSLYGKFIQITKRAEETIDWINFDWVTTINNKETIFYRKVKETGNLFCPVYASYITSSTRIQLLEQLIKLQKEAVACFTDSIIATKEWIESSRKLGGWKKEIEGEMILICSGVYTIRNGEKKRIKFRGIVNSNKYDLFEIAKQHKDEKSLNFLLQKAVKLGEALLHTKIHDIEDLNKFKQMEKEINLKHEFKRRWLDTFNTVGELLEKMVDSEPLTFSS